MTTTRDRVLRMQAEYFRICNDNAREFSRHYREQCDRLRMQVVRDGHPDVDGTYMVMKPKDDPIQTAMSRWRWWRDEAERIATEIQAERDLAEMGVPPMDVWFTTTLHECLGSARKVNQALHEERRRRTAMAAHTVLLRTVRHDDPTIPMPRVQMDADERTETPR